VRPAARARPTVGCLATRAARLHPISEHLARITTAFATRWWHWFFFAQPEIPERVISADPDAMGQVNYDESRKAARNRDVVRAMIEDCHAGLTIDRQHDEADRAGGNRLRLPVLVAWSQEDDLEDLYGDPLVIWRDWANDVRGHSIDSGRHTAEEAPDATSSREVRTSLRYHWKPFFQMRVNAWQAVR